MIAFVSWLDYSERERRQALDVIDLFREQDTRDELGIGTIRDTLAERLFPGINTIQTRARYFLFIPWTCQEMERRKVPASEAGLRARKEEVALIEALIASGETEGVIGVDARASLKRLPSNIYWLGLGTWGIRLFAGGQDQYFSSLDGRRQAADHRAADNAEGTDSARPLPAWHPAIPPRPAGFPSGASLALTAQESEYLRERILTRVPHTFLAFLVDEGETSEVAFPWEHPLATKASEAVTEDLFHARNFSETIHGASLFYNLMLSEKAEQEERVEEYRQRLGEWVATLVARASAFARWDRKRLWELTGKIALPTQAFVETWLNLVFPGQRGAATVVDAAALIESERARRLIHERERQLKRAQARLDNPSALRLWNGAAGTGQLSYRWPSAQAIINDILAGLSKETDHA